MKKEPSIEELLRAEGLPVASKHAAADEGEGQVRDAGLSGTAIGSGTPEKALAPARTVALDRNSVSERAVAPDTAEVAARPLTAEKPGVVEEPSSVEKATAIGDSEAGAGAPLLPEEGPRWRGIEVRAGDRRFLVTAEELLAVVAEPEVHSLPLAPPWLVGLTRWRLGPLPVTRLSDLSEGNHLRGALGTVAPGERLLVMRTDSGEPLGLLVSGVTGSRRIRGEEEDLPENTFPVVLGTTAVQDEGSSLPVLNGSCIERSLASLGFRSS